jgi:hypothetical protein
VCHEKNQKNKFELAAQNGGFRTMGDSSRTWTGVARRRIFMCVQIESEFGEQIGSGSVANHESTSFGVSEG